MTRAEALELAEREYFEQLGRTHGWRVSAMAKEAGMYRTSLYRRLRELGMSFPRKNQGNAAWQALA